MLPEKSLAWGKTRSCIRELAEFGAKRKQEIGAENVYDFSLGNPSVPAPACVNEAIAECLQMDSVALHGYTTAAGLMSLRTKLAEFTNKKFNLSLKPELFYVTCGAAASLTVTLNAIVLPGDEVMVIAPFFPEYSVFITKAGGTPVIVPAAADFQIDMDEFQKRLSPKTKAVIINSPNNPCGAIYTEETLKALTQALKAQEEANGETIYLISDEPYREIVYSDAPLPYPMHYYDDTIICYSYSKSLSVPGERIGYIAVGDKVKDAADVYAAVMGAGRSLGFVNPPSLFQRVIEKCLDQVSDISEYRKNRDALVSGLKEIGYEYVEPDGAFYLFVKALEPDAIAFSETAKKHELLLVPSNDFGCEGYVRICYCVSMKTIQDSMPAFKALYEEYNK